MFFTRIYDSRTQKEGNKWFLSFTFAWSFPFEARPNNDLKWEKTEIVQLIEIRERHSNSIIELNVTLNRL